MAQSDLDQRYTVGLLANSS